MEQRVSLEALIFVLDDQVYFLSDLRHQSVCERVVPMANDLDAFAAPIRAALARAEQDRDTPRRRIEAQDALVARRRALDVEPTLYAKVSEAIKMASEADGLRAQRDEALASVARLRAALCCLMDIDGSPESLDLMRVGIVASAEAPDEGARVAAFACIDALAATAPPEGGA